MARRRYPMEAGERDRLVTVQAVTQAVDDEGAPTETVATLCEMWMSKRDASMRERFTVEQLSAPVTTVWEGNYRADMDPELVDVPKTRKLVYQGRTYDITGASMIGVKEGVELTTLAKAD